MAEKKSSTSKKKSTATAKKGTTKKKTTVSKKTKDQLYSELEMPDEVWDQQIEENTSQFLKFCAYRDMVYEMPTEKEQQDGKLPRIRLTAHRSLRKLADQLNLTNKKQLETLSAQFDWVSRCEAYDAYMERLNRRRNEDAIVKMREEHAAVAQQIIRKSTKRLLSLPEDEISATDLIRMFESGVKIERLSRGEATSNAKITGEATITHEGSVEHKPAFDLKALTDEELSSLESICGKFT